MILWICYMRASCKKVDASRVAVNAPTPMAALLTSKVAPALMLSTTPFKNQGDATANDFESKTIPMDA